MYILFFIGLLLTAGNCGLGPCKYQAIDMVTQLLPNYTGSVQPCSYSGFAPLDAQNQSALFYWYFPHQSNVPDQEVPVIIFLNGGPGASSMFGLFAEMGPFSISDNEDGGYSVGYRDGGSDKSWSYYYNMLFIDQPVGVGFSYTTNKNKYPINEEQVAEDLWNVIQFFINIHPETENFKWYICGQSYGGRYVPAAALYIVHQNDKILNNTLLSIPINLQGIMVGNGLLNCISQRTTAVYQAIASSMIAPYQFETAITYTVRCQQEVAKNASASKAQKACNNVYNFMQDVSGLSAYSMAFAYNVTETLGENIQPYLRMPDIWNTIHVQNSKKPYAIYNRSSSVVSDYLAWDVTHGTSLFEVNELVTRIQVLWYDGNFDVRLGSMGSFGWFPLLAPPYNQIQYQDKNVWMIAGIPVGAYTQYGNLTSLVVDTTGHYVPTWKLSVSVEMVRIFTMAGNDWNPYRNSTPVNQTMCSYMKNCNGNGVCNSTGACVCKNDYGLADCSVQAVPLTKANYTLNLRDYLFLKVTFTTSNIQLKITGDDGLLEIFYTNSRNGPVGYDEEANLNYNAVPGFNKTRSVYLYPGTTNVGYLTLHNTDYFKSVTFEVDYAAISFETPDEEFMIEL
jgi:vitellogenic carboxypeptidase-like protein